MHIILIQIIKQIEDYKMNLHTSLNASQHARNQLMNQMILQQRFVNQEPGLVMSQPIGVIQSTTTMGQILAHEGHDYDQTNGNITDLQSPQAMQQHANVYSPIIDNSPSKNDIQNSEDMKILNQHNLEQQKLERQMRLNILRQSQTSNGTSENFQTMQEGQLNIHNQQTSGTNFKVLKPKDLSHNFGQVQKFGSGNSGSKLRIFGNSTQKLQRGQSGSKSKGKPQSGFNSNADKTRAPQDIATFDQFCNSYKFPQRKALKSATGPRPPVAVTALLANSSQGANNINGVVNSGPYTTIVQKQADFKSQSLKTQNPRHKSPSSASKYALNKNSQQPTNDLVSIRYGVGFSRKSTNSQLDKENSKRIESQRKSMSNAAKIAERFNKNNRKLENIFDYVEQQQVQQLSQRQYSRPQTGHTQFYKTYGDNTFVRKNQTREKIQINRAKSDYKNTQFQADKTLLLMQQSKNLATFDRIKRLALFDNNNFHADPLGELHQGIDDGRLRMLKMSQGSSSKQWTSYNQFENLQHNFAQGYISNQYDKILHSQLLKEQMQNKMLQEQLMEQQNQINEANRNIQSHIHN